MKINRYILVLAFLLSAFILMGSGCEGAYSIRGATARDTIFSLETRANGSIVVWLTHDDIGSYCITSNQSALKIEAQMIFNDRNHLPEVYIRYSTINALGDGSQGPIGSITGQGCPDESGSGHTTYIVTDICRVEADVDNYSNCTSIIGR